MLFSLSMTRKKYATRSRNSVQSAAMIFCFDGQRKAWSGSSIETKKLKEDHQNLGKVVCEEIEIEHTALLKNPKYSYWGYANRSHRRRNIVVREWGKSHFLSKLVIMLRLLPSWLDRQRTRCKCRRLSICLSHGDLVMLQFALDPVCGRRRRTQSQRSPQNHLWYSLRIWFVNRMMRWIDLSRARIALQNRGQDLWFAGSAEHDSSSMHANEIFAEKDMPVRYIGYATSFRGEAGTYGKDMEGIIRMHQFDKLEMESFSCAESSHEEHLLFLVSKNTSCNNSNPIPKASKCTFDIGKPNAKGSDIEAWLPGQKYRQRRIQPTIWQTTRHDVCRLVFVVKMVN